MVVIFIIHIFSCLGMLMGSRSYICFQVADISNLAALTKSDHNNHQSQTIALLTTTPQSETKLSTNMQAFYSSEQPRPDHVDQLTTT